MCNSQTGKHHKIKFKTAKFDISLPLSRDLAGQHEVIWETK